MNDILLKILDSDWLKPFAFPSLVTIFVVLGTYRVVIWLRNAGFIKARSQKRQELMKFIREHLRDGLASDPVEIEALKEEAGAIAFEEIAGFRAKNRFRHELLKLHKSSQDGIDWAVFRQALPYLKDEDDKPVIKFDMFDRSVLAFSFVAAVPLVLMILGLLIVLGRLSATDPLYWRSAAVVNLVLLAVCALFFGLILTISKAFQAMRLRRAIVKSAANAAPVLHDRLTSCIQTDSSQRMAPPSQGPEEHSSQPAS